MNLIDKTISALVYTIAVEHERRHGVHTFGRYLGVTEFVTGQVAHMTAPLRLPMRIATGSLTVLALLATGSLFHRLTAERRQRLVDRWRTSRCGPIRDVIRFYDSLAVLALYGSEQA